MLLSKCSFCLSDSYKRGLIDIKSKVYGLFDSDIELSKIAFDILNLQVSFHFFGFYCNLIYIVIEFIVIITAFQLDEARICEDCQKQLVDAYVFKTKASKVLETLQLGRRLELQRNVDKFIKTFSDVNELSLMHSDQCLAIVASTQKKVMEMRGWHDYHPDEEESKDEQLETDHVETESYMKMELSQKPLLQVVPADNHDKVQAADKMDEDNYYDASDNELDDDDNDVLESDDTDIENGVESSHEDDLSCLEGLLEETQDALHTTISNDIPTMASELNGESSLASTSTESSKIKNRPWWTEIMEKSRSVVQTEDGPLTILKCFICQKVYFTNKGMRMHIQGMHDKSKPQAKAQVKSQANVVVKTLPVDEIKRVKRDKVN